ncbi:hypothetical protein GYMLUDRAFT_40385 [Collybiopsis luxurians FD-317 M1]|uniref:Uncharacterized protein n=1 Tax=Collybiopsis luxurians FD-317 M1 TaxID=944289 RepID=A0A0D0C7H2_9AGAR|nr:hypothetical protein GYMLUDRAFT_40385 [Collybiopsis luxurians FD-317 M1]
MPLIRVFHSITTSRIVLHIREAMNRTVVQSLGGLMTVDTTSEAPRYSIAPSSVSFLNE